MASMRDQAIGAAIGVIVAAALGVIGNAVTEGWLVRQISGATTEDIKALETRLKELEQAPAPAPIGKEIASGTVVAFDLPNGCPDGWTEFADAAGRVIIGQGSGMVDENGQPLMSRKYREHGGEEKHTLTVAEMPSHQHSVYQHAGYHGGDVEGASAGDARTMVHAAVSGPTGGGEAHNNMPPYVALYFCKKD